MTTRRRRGEDGISFEHHGPCRDPQRHRHCPGLWRGEITVADPARRTVIEHLSPVTDLPVVAGFSLPRTGGRRTGARVSIIPARPAIVYPAAAVTPTP
jgi:hypothetical protein